MTTLTFPIALAAAGLLVCGAGCAFGGARGHGNPYSEFGVESLTEQQRKLVEPLLGASDFNDLTEATYQCVLGVDRMNRLVEQHEAALQPQTTRWTRDELTALRDFIDRALNHCDRALSSSETLPRDRALAREWADRGRARISPFKNGSEYAALAPLQGDLRLAEAMIRAGRAAAGLFFADEVRRRAIRVQGVRPTVVVAALDALEALEGAGRARTYLRSEPLASDLARRVKVRALLAQSGLRSFERAALTEEDFALSRQISTTLERFDAESVTTR